MVQGHATASNIRAVVDFGGATVKLAILNEGFRFKARLLWLVIVKDKTIRVGLRDSASKVNCFIGAIEIDQTNQKWLLAIAQVRVRRLLHGAISVCLRLSLNLSSTNKMSLN